MAVADKLAAAAKTPPLGAPPPLSAAGGGEGERAKAREAGTGGARGEDRHLALKAFVFAPPGGASWGLCWEEPGPFVKAKP